MSGSFEGFSEADIIKINGNGQLEQSFNLYNKPSSNRKKLKAVKKNFDKNTIRNKACLNKIIQNSTYEPIMENAKLVINSSRPENEEISNLDLNKSDENTKTESKTTGSISTTAESLEKEVKCENEAFQDMQITDRKLNLEEFQIKQKFMEEQNKKRKELLAKILAVKTKQTKEEAQRLNEINEELKKLDLLLSSDVNVLRKQIEIASLDFMEAEKRYCRIEKEFLQSKLLLHQKLDRKEMLTEHLYAIIEKNEERKADKLNQLLSKLNLSIEAEANGEINNCTGSQTSDNK